jgi:hypothetical protein
VHPLRFAALTCKGRGEAGGSEQAGSRICRPLPPPASYSLPHGSRRVTIVQRSSYRRKVEVSLEEAQAILAALALLDADRKANAAYALAELQAGEG